MLHTSDFYLVEVIYKLQYDLYNKLSSLLNTASIKQKVCRTVLIPDGIIIYLLACLLTFFFGIFGSGWGKKTPFITLSQLRILLRVILPVRSYDAEAIILFVRDIQIRNHRAYLSHRKKKSGIDSG